MADSFLSAFVKGGIEGQKSKRDELLKKAQMEMAKAENRRGASQWGADNLQVPEFDPSGNFGSYKKDPSVYQNEQFSDQLKHVAAPFFTKKISESKDTSIPLVNEKGQRVKFDSAGNEIVLGPENNQTSATPKAPSVAPLLKSKEETKALAGENPTQKVSFLEEREVAPGVRAITPSGNRVTSYNNGVANTKVDMGGAEVSGQTGIPEKVKEFGLPPPYMLKRIIDYATTGQAKETDPLVDPQALPEKWRDDLGLGASDRTPIRKSLIEKRMNRYSSMPNEADPRTFAYFDMIKNGAPYGRAASALSQELGRNLNTNEEKILRDAERQKGTQGRFDSGGDRQERKEKNAILRSARDRMYSAFKGELDEMQAAMSIKKLLSQKNTAGAEQMIAVMLNKMSGQAGNSISDRDLKSTGISGWGNQIEAYISKAMGEGLTPLDKQRIKGLADTFIDASKKILEAKSGYFRRGAIAEMQSYVDSPDEAARIINDALDVRLLLQQSGGNPSISSSGEVDVSKAKKVAEIKMKEINAKPGLSDVEKQTQVNKVLENFKRITGQDFFKKVK